MVGHLALFLKRFLGRRRIWCSKRSIEELELLEVSILDMTPAYVATSIETRGENTAMIEMRSEEATVKQLWKMIQKKETILLNK